jgi:septum formation protein
MAGIILASASPRRRELLEKLGVENLRVRPAKGEERMPDTDDPAEIVRTLSRQKAEEVARTAEGDDVVVAADTIVWLDGEALGKPKDEEDAKAMLRRLSGRTHSVFTGVCVLCGGTLLSEAEESRVRFRPMSEKEIASYVASGEPMDKAGAYGAQGLAGLFVRRIEGSFSNVMGLPLCRLGNMLKKVGVELL